MAAKYIPLLLLLLLSLISLKPTSAEDPVPSPWPPQFHSILFMNDTKGRLQVNDLWYDWPNGRNFNILQNQLGKLTYDLEWDNGTSYIYTDQGCRVLSFPVGVLRPNWLDGATYLGQRRVDGFLCNVWEKVDFIWYYEDVVSKRPVYWVFFTGMVAHVMTFEVGAVLEDAKWQAPAYCFEEAKIKDSQLMYKDIDGSHFGRLMRGASSSVCAASL